MRRRICCLSLLPLALVALGIVVARPVRAAEPGAHPAPAPTHPKRHVVRHGKGYGFLPGYRPPEVIERERARRTYESGPHWYGRAWPGFYRGRWNGGGFGPCYVSTPIGYMWTCGR